MINTSVLLVAIVVLIVLILIGLALLVVHGIVRSVVARLRGRRIAAARDALLAAARRGEPDDAAGSALRAIPHERALELLEELAPSLAGPELEALSAIARQRGLIADAERECASRRWRTRLHAVRVLALLGGGEATVPRLLDDERPEVRAQAAEWAAGHPESAPKIVAMLDDPGRFVRYTAMDSLIRLRAAAVEPLSAAIETSPRPRAPLEVAARIGDPRLAGPAQARLDDPDAVVRSWAARVLGGLGGDEHAAAVVERLADEDAEVRAAAAVALGRLGHWPSAPAVAALLTDRDWNVRRSAALALRALGPAGELLLRRALRDEDAFARDMAQQTLDLPEAVLPR
ncbi:HEAT repeat domain-containing protein [Solirubrobacter soli]|uniref:HEAT repeat domain-containing protein n=1 Tax=Solirubrobacter soli TaxID=363832 RepID=UPI00041EF2EA|nr:HEAT repeat domain-containing protein [Solirubrobacter soli]